MVHDPRVSSVLLSVMLVAACEGKGTSPSNAKAAAEAENQDAAAREGEPDRPKPAGPLSQEEKDLIAADPKDLTPEQRRKRAYALRKKIMQNPDSPTARTLEELRRAALDGELEIPEDITKGGAKKDTRLEARKPSAPESGKAPASNHKRK
ncbi:MAG: hypothetical protein ACYTGC_08035 [Planctomycetota bacterium]|jgi:hypothetical protein